MWRAGYQTQNVKVLVQYYNRRAVARTLMARLPRLFRTRSSVPWKNYIAADYVNFE